MATRADKVFLMPAEVLRCDTWLEGEMGINKEQALIRMKGERPLIRVKEERTLIRKLTPTMGRRQE